MLDAEDCIRILIDDKARGMYKHWTLDILENEFHNRWGRRGVWEIKKLQFCAWLSCFQRTFEVFGTKNQYVRVRHKWGRTTLPRVIDKMDSVMVNLARIQNPRLIRFQKLRLVNEKEIKGWDLPGVAEHKFVTDLEQSYEVPHGCLVMEEHMKYGVRLQPRVMEKIHPKQFLAGDAGDSGDGMFASMNQGAMDQGDIN